MLWVNKKDNSFRWVPFKPYFLGAWKSVWLISTKIYIKLYKEKEKMILAKIWGNWESNLTAVQLKQDPPVINCPQFNVFMTLFLILSAT